MVYFHMTTALVKFLGTFFFFPPPYKGTASLWVAMVQRWSVWPRIGRSQVWFPPFQLVSQNVLGQDPILHLVVISWPHLQCVNREHIFSPSSSYMEVWLGPPLWQFEVLGIPNSSLFDVLGPQPLGQGTRHGKDCRTGLEYPSGPCPEGWGPHFLPKRPSNWY